MTVFILTGAGQTRLLYDDGWKYLQERNGSVQTGANLELADVAV